MPDAPATTATPPAPVPAPVVAKPAAPGTGAVRTPMASQATPPVPGSFRVHSLTSERRTRRIKALMYGPPGVGKSTLCGSATELPEMRDVFLLTSEGGDIVFEDNPLVPEPDNIDLVKIDNVNQLTKVYEFLKLHTFLRQRNDQDQLKVLQDKVFDPEIIQEPDRLRKFQTCILDSLTDIEGLNLNTIMGLDTQGFAMGDASTEDWGVYRKNGTAIINFIRSLRNLDMNLLIICSARMREDQQKLMHYYPALTGQLMTQIQGQVDLVGFMAHAPAGDVQSGVAKEGDRRMFIRPPSSGARFDAKCRRASVTKAYYDNPTMKDIMVDFGFAQVGAGG